MKTLLIALAAIFGTFMSCLSLGLLASSCFGVGLSRVFLVWVAGTSRAQRNPNKEEEVVMTKTTGTFVVLSLALVLASCTEVVTRIQATPAQFYIAD